MTEPGLRERSKARRRAAIIDAALVLFAERGYAATTIADIARDAELAPRTVSLYFPSKQDIALAGAAEAAGRLAQALGDRRPGESTVELFGAWLRKELTQLDPASLDRARRVFARNPELRALLTSYMDVVMAEGTRAIAAELGVDADDSRPRVATAALMGVLEYVWTSVTADEIDETIEVATRFLVAGMASLRPA